MVEFDVLNIKPTGSKGIPPVHHTFFLDLNTSDAVEKDIIGALPFHEEVSDGPNDKEEGIDEPHDVSQYQRPFREPKMNNM